MIQRLMKMDGIVRRGVRGQVVVSDVLMVFAIMRARRPYKNKV